MKNQVWIATVIILAIVLGGQSYMLFQLNHKVNRLSGQEDTDGGAKIDLSKPLLPQARAKDFPFSDQWKPYAEMERMREEMEQVFEDSFSRFHMKTPSGGYNKTPDVDLRETSDSYVVTVNVPGADQSTLDVRVEDDILKISVKTERSTDESKRNGQYRRRERFIGEFQRSLTLPGRVDSTNMKTDYQNGVLTITLPKK